MRIKGLGCKFRVQKGEGDRFLNTSSQHVGREASGGVPGRIISTNYFI